MFSVYSFDSITDKKVKNTIPSATCSTKRTSKNKLCRPEDGFFKCDNAQCIPRNLVRDFSSDCTYHLGFDERSGEFKK